MRNANTNDTKNSTPEKTVAQPKIVKKERLSPPEPQDVVSTGVINLKDIANTDYNIKEIKKFTRTVFHDLLDDEQVLTWYQKRNTPSFPKPLEKTMQAIKQTNLPRAFYFGTATVTKDVDGKLYNRKKNFDRLHVIVLDDIGTKVRAEDLPEDLTPNYIIETSEGNFQYGYILAEPIDDIALAEALVHLVYTSGYSDGGGKMPNKVVRLPCGINGKEGEKGNFEVRLLELNTDYWLPEDLLDVMDVGVTWTDVLKDVNAAKRGKSAMVSGTSQWSPITSVAGSLNGVVDQMLEWLYDNDLVTNDNGDWVTIQCPWHDEHSDKNDTAGYSPVGRGGQFSNVRSFNCFHDHCKDRKGSDFLEWAIALGAPRVPLIDNVADLVAEYAYVSSEDSAYRLRGVQKPTGIKIGAFKNTYPKKVPVYDVDGKLKMVNEHALWLTAPNRLTLQGAMMNVANPEKIVRYDGQNYLNLYAPPVWGKGTYNKDHVARFNAFLEYLVPTDVERDYFLQWLSAKAQTPTFKGAAVLMVAPTQGTGRTTLTDMVTTLFTPENVRKVTFPQLCSASDAGVFNDWQESLMVTCDEIMSDTSNKHRVYETMKDLFDPRPKTVLINSKYGSQRHSPVYTSYFLLTNHTDAVGQLGGDRRVYVIENNDVPETPEYFTELNAWLDEKTVNGTYAWAESVWRWLQTLTPDLMMLNAPTPMTAAKQTMISETTSVYDLVAEVIADLFMGIIPCGNIEALAQDVLENRRDPDAQLRAKIIVANLKKISVASAKTKKVGSRTTRVRVVRKQFLAFCTTSQLNKQAALEEYVDLNFDAIKMLLDEEHKLILEINRLVDERV